MAVVVPELTAGQRDRIRAAAEGHGFEVRFLNTPKEDTDFLNGAEVNPSSDRGVMTARHRRE